MAPRALDAIISGKMTSLAQLRPHAPAVLDWLKDGLPRAHEDDDLKKQIELLLGAPRFAPNLAHLGLWDDLIEDCNKKALVLGKPMQEYFVKADLGTVLGEAAVPNKCGRFEVLHDGLLEVVASSQEEGIRRQDAAMPFPFPRNLAFSQLWNEQCFIHCIRMIAMAIDPSFQLLVSGVCEDANGTFKGCAIKGFVRMLNKCVSHDDHYWEEFPRPSLNIDLNRNACTFETSGSAFVHRKNEKAPEDQRSSRAG